MSHWLTPDLFFRPVARGIWGAYSRINVLSRQASWGGTTATDTRLPCRNLRFLVAVVRRRLCWHNGRLEVPLITTSARTLRLADQRDCARRGHS